MRPNPKLGTALPEGMLSRTKGIEKLVVQEMGAKKRAQKGQNEPESGVMRQGLGIIKALYAAPTATPAVLLWQVRSLVR